MSKRVKVELRGGALAIRILKGRLLKPDEVLKKIGALALADAQKAFDDQALGSEAWPERYPNQSRGKVNVAGIVADFIAGKRNPPGRRFEARPAGIDSGMLRRSLTPSKALTLDGNAVVVGSTQPNASIVQWGGETEQPISKSVKALLADYLRGSRRRIKRAKKVSQPLTMKDAMIQRLGFLFQLKSLKTKVAARPYLGLTPELAEKITILVEAEITE